MGFIQRIMDWNTAMGNKKGSLRPLSEIKRLMEEVDEYITAFNEWDIVEVLDGAVDIVYILMGTLHKLGFTENFIIEAIKEVTDSNYSKFPLEQAEDGKVKKWKNYEPPKLKQMIDLYIAEGNIVVDIT